MPAGGARQGSGRKPKADEQLLIEKLSPLDNQAFELLQAGLEAKDFNYLKLFMEYRFGKPKQQLQLSNDEENPLFTSPQINVYTTTPPLSSSEDQIDV